eukprot:465398-Hanusia_phi.AAC.6
MFAYGVEKKRKKLRNSRAVDLPVVPPWSSQVLSNPRSPLHCSRSIAAAAELLAYCLPWAII